MGKRIVLFNDLPGYGKVALAAMVPLFSRMGHFPYQVPTAVVSNTLDFGKFRIQDMTDYMRDTIKVWDELGFDPDCICTGFVLSEEQVELIGDYIRSRKPRMDEIQNVDNGRLVLVDPIMADGGKLYNGIDREYNFRKLQASGFASVLLCLTQSVPHIIFNLSNGGAYRHTSNISNISLLAYGLFTAAFTLAHFSLKNTSAGEQK